MVVFNLFLLKLFGLKILNTSPLINFIFVLLLTEMTETVTLVVGSTSNVSTSSLSVPPPAPAKKPERFRN